MLIWFRQIRAGYMYKQKVTGMKNNVAKKIKSVAAIYGASVKIFYVTTTDNCLLYSCAVYSDDDLECNERDKRHHFWMELVSVLDAIVDEQYRDTNCVLLESPYRADTPEDFKDNVEFARACLKDSLMRGESPMASHLLYTQALDDKVPTERSQGIAAGIQWQKVVDCVVVYVNRGISEGMQKSIDAARARKMTVKYRMLKLN